MRGLLWTVLALALATALDASFYDGRYAQAASRLLTEIAIHFR
jgi:hypothetical protein